ncbi:MAG: hypothetical protein IPJ65_29870 [Archangiaceae bacterium]|nr:hypothetical protein [Archangiaceae bacterium]
MRLAAVVVLLGAGAAGAQGFDFQRQDISVDVTGATPVLDVTLTALVKQDTGVFDFFIPPSMVQLDVAGMSLGVAPHPQQPAYLYRATLPSTATAGQTVVLHARLTGGLRCTTAPAGQPPGCFFGPGGTLLIPSTPTAAWYFVNLYETDPFEGRIAVRTAASHTALASHGAGQVEDLGDGTRRWTFELASPTEMLSLAEGDWSSVEASGPMPVKGYYPRSLNVAEPLQRAVNLAAQVLPIYTRLYGELPVHEAQLVTAPSTLPGAGMGMLGTVFFNENVFVAYPYLIEQGVAHELAHSWWGNLTEAEGDERGFMGEAFAEYSAWRALGELQGDAARTSGMRMNAVWYQYRTPAGQDVAPLSAHVARAPGYVFVTYHKGPLALRAMEEVAGVEAFTQGLKSVAHLPVGELSMAKLVAAVKAAGGADLTDEVSQWLYQAGYPTLKVAATREAGAVRWALQSTGHFSYRLPVRVRLSNGKVVEQTVAVPAGASSVTVPVESDLETIEVDPRWTLPREVLPASSGDVTFDGVVDGRDLLEVAVRVGAALPTERRVDGRYDPLFDVDGDRSIGLSDLLAVVNGATH